MALMGWQTE